MEQTFELPHPAIRSHPKAEALSRDRRIHEVIGIFLGFGRSYPPEILDDELLVQIEETIQRAGSTRAAGEFYRTSVPKHIRAECRAVLMNLTRLRNENGGHLPWER